MGVLTRCRHSDGSRPVEVEMAHLVGDALVVVWFQSHAVVDDVVMGWGDTSLSHALGHQEEIKQFLSGDHGVYNSTRGRVGCTLCTGEERRVDSLLYDDYTNLGMVFHSDLFEGLPDLCELVIEDDIDLTVTNTITVDEDPLWQIAVVLVESFQGSNHVDSESLG